MKTLYISIGLLEGAAREFRQQEVSPVIEVFISKLLQYTLQNRRTGKYHFKNADGTAKMIRSFSDAVLRGDEDGGDKIRAHVSAIAGKLAEAEQAAERKVRAMGGSVKTGSLVLALLADETQGLCAVLAKVDHSKWIDSVDLSIQTGFPYDDKDIWKTAIVRLGEDGGLKPGAVSVYMDRPAAYWTEGFLGLLRERTDEDNTRIVCQRVLKAISNRLNRLEAAAFMNAFMLKMQNDTELNYPDLVNELVSEERAAEPALNKLREELLALPSKYGFDTQFTIVRAALPKEPVKQSFKVNDYMDLVLTAGDYEPGKLIEAREENSGERWLVIRCTDHKTFECFKRKKS